MEDAGSIIDLQMTHVRQLKIVTLHNFQKEKYGHSYGINDSTYIYRFAQFQKKKSLTYIFT